MRIAHLGPAGTFSEEAALLYDADADLVPYPTITGSARAVRDGDSDLAICPIENSLQGAVTETVDLLIHEAGYAITGEVNLGVVHNLMALPGVTLGDIRRVYSHPQALGQCQGWLADHLPGVEAAAALSTAGSVEQAADTGFFQIQLLAQLLLCGCFAFAQHDFICAAVAFALKKRDF